MQFHRAAKIHPPEAWEEDQELDEESQTVEDDSILLYTALSS